MNRLQSKFEILEIELKAMNGAISEQDYEDKIKETFRHEALNVQLGAVFDYVETKEKGSNESLSRY